MQLLAPSVATMLCSRTQLPCHKKPRSLEQSWTSCRRAIKLIMVPKAKASKVLESNTLSAQLQAAQRSTKTWHEEPQGGQVSIAVAIPDPMIGLLPDIVRQVLPQRLDEARLSGQATTVTLKTTARTLAACSGVVLHHTTRDSDRAPQSARMLNPGVLTGGGTTPRPRVALVAPNPHP
ncbi:hypothetical protein VZT92_027540 [Zoarces viviparus]|uniref:Uncharacterized protein n=2 Tax=Zoarces viviparus TaxID=48416 RepID=A0AAW1DX04_ZOAVI